MTTNERLDALEKKVDALSAVVRHGIQPAAAEDWYEWQGESGVVEPFGSILGSNYFNHGGLLRVTTGEGIVELQRGDWLIVSKTDGSLRVARGQTNGTNV